MLTTSVYRIISKPLRFVTCFTTKSKGTQEDGQVAQCTSNECYFVAQCTNIPAIVHLHNAA